LVDTDENNELARNFIRDKHLEKEFGKYVLEQKENRSSNQNSSEQKRPVIGPDQVILLGQSAEGQAKLKAWGYVKD